MWRADYGLQGIYSKTCGICHPHAKWKDWRTTALSGKSIFICHSLQYKYTSPTHTWSKCPQKTCTFSTWILDPSETQFMILSKDFKSLIHVLVTSSHRDGECSRLCRQGGEVVLCCLRMWLYSGRSQDLSGGLARSVIFSPPSNEGLLDSLPTSSCEAGIGSGTSQPSAGKAKPAWLAML